MFSGSRNQFFSIGISPTDNTATVLITCEANDNNKTCNILYGPHKTNCTADLANADDNWLAETMQIDIWEFYEISLNNNSACIIISVVVDNITVIAAGPLDLDSFTHTDTKAVDEIKGNRNFSFVAIICSSSSVVVLTLACTITTCLVFMMRRRKRSLRPPSKRSRNVYE